MGRQGQFILLLRDRTFSIFQWRRGLSVVASDTSWEGLEDKLRILKGKALYWIDDGSDITLDTYKLPSVFLWERIQFANQKLLSLPYSPFSYRWVWSSHGLHAPYQGTLITIPATAHRHNVQQLLKRYNLTIKGVSILSCLVPDKKQTSTLDAIWSWWRSDQGVGQIALQGASPMMMRYVDNNERFQDPASMLAHEAQALKTYLVSRHKVKANVAMHCINGATEELVLKRWMQRLIKPWCLKIIKTPAPTFQYSYGLRYVALSLFMALLYQGWQCYENLQRITQQQHHHDQLLQTIAQKKRIEKETIPLQEMVDLYEPLHQTIEQFWKTLQALAYQPSVIRPLSFQWLRDQQGVITVGLNVHVSGQNKVLVTEAFDTYIAALQERFPYAKVDLLKAPFNTHPNQLLEGGIEEGQSVTLSSDQDQEGILKLWWPS